MKSIKKFKDKKIENMATIEGGRRYRCFQGSYDKYNKRTGLVITNVGWFDGPRD